VKRVHSVGRRQPNAPLSGCACRCPIIVPGGRSLPPIRLGLRTPDRGPPACRRAFWGLSRPARLGLAPRWGRFGRGPPECTTGAITPGVGPSHHPRCRWNILIGGTARELRPRRSTDCAQARPGAVPIGGQATERRRCVATISGVVDVGSVVGSGDRAAGAAQQYRARTRLPASCPRYRNS